MLRKHRNVLLEAIRTRGLDPRQFAATEEEVEGHKAFRVHLAGGVLYFIARSILSGEARKFDCKYTKYIRKHPSPEFAASGGYSPWGSFEDLVTHFERWLDSSATKFLSDLAEELDDRAVPDLWTELQISSAPETAFDALDNAPFSKDELARISAALGMFEQQAKAELNLSSDQLALLHERIGYLIESSHRLGRKDWLAAAAGALIGFTFQAALTSSTATSLITTAGRAFQWIATTPLFLP